MLCGTWCARVGGARVACVRGQETEIRCDFPIRFSLSSSKSSGRITGFSDAGKSFSKVNVKNFLNLQKKKKELQENQGFKIWRSRRKVFSQKLCQNSTQSNVKGKQKKGKNTEIYDKYVRDHVFSPNETKAPSTFSKFKSRRSIPPPSPKVSLINS